MPGQTRRRFSQQERHRGLPSMEGRAIARPNRPTGERCDQPPQPSMEGRAIARPNVPAAWAVMPRTLSLQWRAGQLPGQTLAFRR